MMTKTKAEKLAIAELLFAEDRPLTAIANLGKRNSGKKYDNDALNKRAEETTAARAKRYAEAVTGMVSGS